MKKHLITLAPVLDEEFRLVDVITISDVLRSLECRVKDSA